jgi:hypothetical protein
MTALSEWYPPISSDVCESFVNETNLRTCKEIASKLSGKICLDNIFKIKDIIPRKTPDNNKLISTSLFYRTADYWQEGSIIKSNNNLFTKEDLEIVGTTPKLKRAGQSFQDCYVSKCFDEKLIKNHPDWDFRVYLANDLQCLIPFFQNLNVEIVLMHHSSDAHNPGALWRYLSMTPTISNHEIVSMRETDEPLVTNAFLKILLDQLNNDCAHLSRGIQQTNTGNEMSLILGGQFACKPYKLNVNIETLMLGFIYMSLIKNDLRKVKYPNYGFDEAFLKHVIYWMLTNRGNLSTVIKKDLECSEDILQASDIEIQKKNNCHLVYI